MARNDERRQDEYLNSQDGLYMLIEDLAKAKTWIVPDRTGSAFTSAAPDDPFCARYAQRQLDPSRSSLELRGAIAMKFSYGEYDYAARDRLKPFRDELERRKLASVEAVCHCTKVNHEPGAREPYACFVDHVFRFE